MPYFIGSDRKPTNTSLSPSLSISATVTQDLFSNMRGMLPRENEKWPLPSLINNLSAEAIAFAGISFPPLTTHKSRYPSPFASKNSASTSSQIANSLNNAVSIGLKEPPACWIINAPGCCFAPHRYKSSSPSLLISATAIFGPRVDCKWGIRYWTL